MNQEQWWAVVSALEDVKVLIEGARGLEAARSAMRSRLTQARRALSEGMPEMEVYKIMFPVVVYCDELMLRRISAREQTQWLPLQTELYKINDGGEAVYRLLDEELDKPDMLPALVGVHYYCLNDGFVGRHSEQPVKIQEYKDRLATKIQARATKLAAREGRDGEKRTPRAKGGPERRKRSARVARKAEPAAAQPQPKAAAPSMTFYYTAAALIALPLLLLWIMSR